MENKILNLTIRNKSVKNMKIKKMLYIMKTKQDKLNENIQFIIRIFNDEVKLQEY